MCLEHVSMVDQMYTRFTTGDAEWSQEDEIADPGVDIDQISIRWTLLFSRVLVRQLNRFCYFPMVFYC